METDAPPAPPVVAVVVVHADPETWFDETLASIAAQDYPNLNTLFLLTGPSDAEALEARITSRLPDAFVRDLGANPGFGPAANEVLRLVEGDSGFFLFCHDDVALDPDCVRMLVEELYRSNAGVVGPKLVSWDDPAVLQHVGLGLDRFGEVDPITEPGEYDQEQHDAVRDVFTLPSACLLVRADLFRTLGGFDPAISFHGDDIELCWRIHLSGARVVVAPQARVRHREELEVRRPDLDHDVLRARHRMRTVATLTSGSRLPVRSLEMVVLTLAELVVGLFTGRLGEAWASLRALVGLIPRTPALLARRGAVSKVRQVTDNEILAPAEPGERPPDVVPPGPRHRDVRRRRAQRAQVAAPVARTGDRLDRRDRRDPRRQPDDVRHQGPVDRRVPPAPGQPAGTVERLHDGVEPGRTRQHVGQPDGMGGGDAGQPAVVRQVRAGAHGHRRRAGAARSGGGVAVGHPVPDQPGARRRTRRSTPPSPLRRE